MATAGNKSREQRTAFFRIHFLKTKISANRKL
jgi:hypothetical protein